MTVLYQPEYDDCKQILAAAMTDSGIPAILRPHYVRLMAAEFACAMVDVISTEQLKASEETKG